MRWAHGTGVRLTGAAGEQMEEGDGLEARVGEGVGFWEAVRSCVHTWMYTATEVYRHIYIYIEIERHRER